MVSSKRKSKDGYHRTSLITITALSSEQVIRAGIMAHLLILGNVAVSDRDKTVPGKNLVIVSTKCSCKTQHDLTTRQINRCKKSRKSEKAVNCRN